MFDESPPIEDENAEQRRYYPGEEPVSLSTAVVEAVAAHENEALTESGFALFDSIDPDALDRLFREDADAELTVQFRLDDVRVSLWGDGRVDIRVTDRVT